MTVFSDGRYLPQQVNVIDLVDEQRSFLGVKLSELIDRLRRDEMAHRNKHKREILENVLPDEYAFAKIYEGTNDQSMFPLVAIHVQEINRSLDKFKAALEVRGEMGGTAADHLKEIVYPLEKLDQYANGADEKFGDRDAYIFAYFVQGQVDQLRIIAKELDEKYAAQP